jgi:hypothetical protein
MTRKRTPLVPSEKKAKSSEEIASEALSKIHGETSPKKPGPIGFFAQWPDTELTKLFVKIPKDIKKRLKVTALNHEKTEAQIVYEILNKYLDN